MTTKADTSVKWFHSDMADAPILRGQAGALIELLDACLLSGFSTRTPDSVVVSAGVATVSIGAGNPYEKHAVIAISGASTAALNSEWRIDSATVTSLTFRCPGVVDGAVTGASIKRAPAGWEKPFGGTNTAAYRAINPYGTRFYLRVNDNSQTESTVRGYEQMTDIDSGTMPFPTFAQLSEALFVWPKSDVAGTSARSWFLASDGQMIIFCPMFSVAANSKLASILRFGDIVSFLPGDGFGCCIAAHATAKPSSPAVSISTTMSLSSTSGCYLARGLSQVSGAIPHRHIFPMAVTGNAAASCDGKLHFAQVIFADGAADTSVRGIMPGMRLSLDRLLGVTRFAVEEDVAGAAHLHVQVGVSADDGRYALVDITGPWK